MPDASALWWYVPEPHYPEDGGWVGRASSRSDALAQAKAHLGYEEDDISWAAGDLRPEIISEDDALAAFAASEA